MSRYRVTLKPQDTVSNPVDLKLRMTKTAPTVEPVVVVDPAPPCQSSHCLVRWVGPWLGHYVPIVTGAFVDQIVQRSSPEYTPDDPDTPDTDETAIIPGGSTNCRVPLIWVLHIEGVEYTPEIVNDFTITQHPDGSANGPWDVVGDGAHAADYPTSSGAQVIAQAYLQGLYFANGDPVPFGDPIAWTIS
jgi:hypothetical protein